MKEKLTKCQEEFLDDLGGFIASMLGKLEELRSLKFEVHTTDCKLCWDPHNHKWVCCG
jgi:hypothetical protein